MNSPEMNEDKQGRDIHIRLSLVRENELLHGLNILRVEHRNQMCLTSLQGFHFQIQLHPVELAVTGVRVDAHDGPFEPTFTLPELGIEINLDAVT